VGEHLLGLSQSGTLFLARANPTRFELIGKIAKVLEGSECWALPVVRQGLIYVRDHGRIVCLDARLVPLP
jgi:hypothetical protein